MFLHNENKLQGLAKICGENTTVGEVGRSHFARKRHKRELVSCVIESLITYEVTRMERAHKGNQVLLYGDSYIRRIRDFSLEPSNVKYFEAIVDGSKKVKGDISNFFLAEEEAHVRSFGWGGATLASYPAKPHKSIISTTSVIEKCEPSIVFLHIGSNDLAIPECDPNSLARALLSFADYLVTGHDISFVVIGDLIARERVPPTVKDYNARVAVVNRELKRLIKERPRSRIAHCQHKGLRNPTESIYLKDGIHLNGFGNERFMRSIRGALMRALKYKAIDREC